MSSVAANSMDRVDPESMRGRLVESEHRGRYEWASRVVSGRRVLDAGCGTGYGLAILERAGAEHVVGVDLADEALAAAGRMFGSERTEFVQADVRRLPFGDGEFDVVVCFEVIEHIDEQPAALDELRRVLRPDGLLVISTPNRLVYPPGNPHHVHEYEPQEFARELSSRFTNVALYRQGPWLASGIFDDGEFAASGPDEALRLKTVKLEGRAPGEETYTLGVASNAELPAMEPLLMIGDPFEARWWQEQVDRAREEAIAPPLEMQRDLEAARAALGAAEEREADRARRLLEVEQRVARESARALALEADLADARRRMDETAARAAHAESRVERGDRVLAEMQSSLSWRITKPIRSFKRLFRRQAVSDR